MMVLNRRWLLLLLLLLGVWSMLGMLRGWWVPVVLNRLWVA